MQRLSVETFLSSPHDCELAQYRVLQAMKEYDADFSHSRLYPGLSDLVSLHDQLVDLLQQKDDLHDHFPRRLKEIDDQSDRLVYEPFDADPPGLESVIGLIRWGLPLIKKSIDEGVEIYNFVDGHIAIEDVGIMPIYREEGYWFVPELQRSLLHLMRYEVSLFTSSSGRYRSLKTRLLESIEERYIGRPAESIKLSLIEKHRDLPNPATYWCQTDLEFPFNETMLPVAKRKLMNHLFS